MKKGLYRALVICGMTLVLMVGLQSANADGHNRNMSIGLNGWETKELFTVGESVGDYTPLGVIDGMGAYKLNGNTVRLLVNHELLHFRGYPYELPDGNGGSFSMTGARVTYFDIDSRTMQIKESGLAYDTIYDANGDRVSDVGFQVNNMAGFSRFCSAMLVERRQFGGNRGFEDRIFLTGEEDGGNFNPVGGGEWALDPASGEIWHLPDLGRGAWENVTQVDTGSKDYVAVILADDSSPFNADDDEENEAAPLFMYVGKKDKTGDFPARNGLRGGQLYVWVSDTGETTPADFNTAGTLSGSWIEVDNSRNLELADEVGANGYDEYGYPTQSNLWSQAEALGAFGFSRPEDVATNPNDGTEIVLASTGVDTYVIDPVTGNGADTFGTMYTVKTDFSDMGHPTATLTIIYDGDADPSRALRSPDNLEWAQDGYLMIQEDEAEEDTASGDEVLFGEGAANPNEAGIVRMDPVTGENIRVANIDRSVVLDPSIAVETDAVDVDAGLAGEWESSGIVDVSHLFKKAPGTLFLFNVQAHGVEDQDQFNAASRIVDSDLVEGGQISWLYIDSAGKGKGKEKGK